jgi:hypothetical protein
MPTLRGVTMPTLGGVMRLLSKIVHNSMKNRLLCIKSQNIREIELVNWV